MEGAAHTVAELLPVQSSLHLPLAALLLAMGYLLLIPLCHPWWCFGPGETLQKGQLWTLTQVDNGDKFSASLLLHACSLRGHANYCSGTRQRENKVTARLFILVWL